MHTVVQGVRLPKAVCMNVGDALHLLVARLEESQVYTEQLIPIRKEPIREDLKLTEL